MQYFDQQFASGKVRRVFRFALHFLERFAMLLFRHYRNARGIEICAGEIDMRVDFPAGSRDHVRVNFVAFGEGRRRRCGALIGGACQPRRNGDHRKDGVPTWAYDAPGRSESFKLARQATKHVGMADCIETSVSERQRPAIRRRRPLSAC